jgi:hypothetical protein
MKKILPLILFIFSMSACSEVPYSLTDAEEYGISAEETVKKYTSKAEQGDADAQYNLGSHYEFSDKHKNIDVAIKWYEKAASQGHIDSMNSLGALYDPLYGRKKDAKKSFYWNKKAAENGNTDSQVDIADAYEKGEVVEQNTALSVMWLSKAANAGDNFATYQLADRYYIGDGVEQNYAKAIALYKKAAKEDNPYAKRALVNALYKDEDYIEAFKYAQEYYEPYSILTNDAQDSYILGEMYELGRGTRQDIKKAKENYGKSCDDGWQIGCDKYRQLNEKSY